MWFELQLGVPAPRQRVDDEKEPCEPTEIGRRSHLRKRFSVLGPCCICAIPIEHEVRPGGGLRTDANRVDCTSCLVDRGSDQACSGPSSELAVRPKTIGLCSSGHDGASDYSDEARQYLFHGPREPSRCYRFA